jgi:putative FmdB family regulatory protein
MPTYEFRCPDGHEFEKFYRKISDAVSELPCPECGKLAMRQVSGGAGLVFKGSGFYLTDYGKNAHRKAAPESGGSDSKGSDSAPASESKSSESKSSEAKPSESKSGESKSGGSRSGESKAPAEPAAAKKPAGGKKSET